MVSPLCSDGGVLSDSDTSVFQDGGGTSLLFLEVYLSGMCQMIFMEESVLCASHGTIVHQYFDDRVRGLG